MLTKSDIDWDMLTWCSGYAMDSVARMRAVAAIVILLTGAAGGLGGAVVAVDPPTPDHVLRGLSDPDTTLSGLSENASVHPDGEAIVEAALASVPVRGFDVAPVSAVPEPSMLPMWSMLGLALLRCVRRHRH